MDLPVMADHAGDAAELMRQLSNQNRLMIVCSLVDSELSVTELNERVPLSQSALSQHLANLRKSELVATRRDGLTIYYRLHGDKATRVISLLKDMFCPDE